MLTSLKKEKLVAALKSYQKTYLQSHTDLDESGTRIMINAFLTEVLGYTALHEVKTEYMIRGTYADYMVQTNGVRHFLVEVKALSIDLSEKHLRQAINYGANEGVEWALLTNGRQFEFYKIIFSKPIESKLIFSVDLSNPDFKAQAEQLQFLHKDSVLKEGLDVLWNNNQALDVITVAGILLSEPVTSIVRNHLKKEFGVKFELKEIESAIRTVVTSSINIESVKVPKIKKKKRAVVEGKPAETTNHIETHEPAES